MTKCSPFETLLFIAVTFGTVTLVACSERPASKSPQPARVHTSPTEVVLKEAVPVGDVQAMPLERLTRLEFLDDQQTMSEWTWLVRAGGLRRFRFDGPANDELIVQLASLKSLQILNLPNVTYSDDALPSLLPLDDLESLRIGADRSHDALVAQIVMTRPQLSHLHLIHGSLGEESVRTLASHETLASLYLDDVAVPESALKALVNRDPPIHLHVNQLHLDDQPSTPPKY